MGKRDSFSDPLRPRLNPLDFRPHYEDRVLVKRLPWPKDSGMLWTPGRPKDGPQLGEVMRVGLGNRGNFQGIEGLDWFNGRWLCACQPGNKVLYARVPPQEFEHEGETYTFLFEENHVLGIIEP